MPFFVYFVLIYSFSYTLHKEKFFSIFFLVWYAFWKNEKNYEKTIDKQGKFM